MKFGERLLTHVTGSGDRSGEKRNNNYLKYVDSWDKGIRAVDIFKVCREGQLFRLRSVKRQCMVGPNV